MIGTDKGATVRSPGFAFVDNLAGSTDRVRWGVTFAALVAVLSAWSLATPLFGGPDEPSHVTKAAATVRGQLALNQEPLPDHRGEGIALFRLPSIFSRAEWMPMCYIFRPEQPADCSPPFSGDGGEAVVGSPAGFYPPTYYAVAGLPTIPFRSTVGIYMMRLTSGMMAAALLASALVAASLARRRFAVVGVTAALTPMVFFSSAIVNPSGVEIAAAVALWTSGLLLFLPGRAPKGRVVARVGASAAVLVLMRPISPVWLLVVGVLLLLSGSWARTRMLIRRADVRTWAAIVAVATLAATSWIVLVKPSRLPSRMVDTAPAWEIALSRLKTWHGPHLEQMIGFFGWLDARAPRITYVLWYAVLAYVLVMLGRTSPRIVGLVGALIASTYLIPLAFEVRYAPFIGPFWQGRYTLPLAVGIPIVVGLARTDEPAVLPRHVWARHLPFAALGLAHALAFLSMLRRFAVGADGPLFFFFDYRWSPVVPVPLVALAGTSAILVLYLWLGKMSFCQEGGRV